MRARTPTLSSACRGALWARAASTPAMSTTCNATTPIRGAPGWGHKPKPPQLPNIKDRRLAAEYTYVCIFEDRCGKSTGKPRRCRSVHNPSICFNSLPLHSSGLTIKHWPVHQLPWAQSIYCRPAQNSAHSTCKYNQRSCASKAAEWSMYLSTSNHRSCTKEFRVSKHVYEASCKK